MKSKDSIAIAVLPFENLSDQNDTAIFCKSLTIDLITQLSYFKQFNIIALQASSAILADSRIDIEKLLAWGIDYYIHGSYRESGQRIRVNAQLSHTTSQRLVWANRFEGALNELVTIQDELLNQVASALPVRVNQDLLLLNKHKSHTELKAYEYWLLGVEAIKKGSHADDLQARDYFSRALEIDPDYALAHSGMSLTYFNEWSCQLWDRWDASLNGAFDWAKKAIGLDDDNYIAAFIIGRVLLFKASYESAEYYLRKSLNLNGNDPDSLIQIASCFIYLGHLQEALDMYRQAQKLNPVGADSYNIIGVLIYFEMGEYEKAKRLLQKTQSPGFLDTNAFIAAIYYFLGDYRSMKSHWLSFMQSYREKINRGTSSTALEAANWVKQINPYRHPSNILPFLEFITEGEINLALENQPSEDFPGLKSFIFQKAGDVWHYSYDGKQGYVKEVKGFYDIFKLLMSPGLEIPCTELMGVLLVQKGEAVMDEQAKASYLTKLRNLQAEIAEVEQLNDLGRSETLQKEYDRLIEFLSKNFDQKGRSRKTNDTDDKVRSAVTWRIRSAISKLEKVHPDLGKHFRNTIKTGIYCSYKPESDIEWNK